METIKQYNPFGDIKNKRVIGGLVVGAAAGALTVYLINK